MTANCSDLIICAMLNSPGAGSSLVFQIHIYIYTHIYIYIFTYLHINLGHGNTSMHKYLHSGGMNCGLLSPTHTCSMAPNVY